MSSRTVLHAPALSGPAGGGGRLPPPGTRRSWMLATRPALPRSERPAPPAGGVGDESAGGRVGGAAGDAAALGPRGAELPAVHDGVGAGVRGEAAEDQGGLLAAPAAVAGEADGGAGGRDAPGRDRGLPGLVPHLPAAGARPAARPVHAGGAVRRRRLPRAGLQGAQLGRQASRRPAVLQHPLRLLQPRPLPAGRRAPAGRGLDAPADGRRGPPAHPRPGGAAPGVGPDLQRRVEQPAGHDPAGLGPLRRPQRPRGPQRLHPRPAGERRPPSSGCTTCAGRSASPPAPTRSGAG